jgi:hypothetical protein
MSEQQENVNGDDVLMEGPKVPRARAFSHDIIRTSVTIHEEVTSTGAHSGATSNIVRWIYTPRTYRPEDPTLRCRQPIRRSNTWEQ